jgi:molecular chaperone GrpE
MSESEKKGRRRVEVTGPEQDPPEAQAEDAEQPAERPEAPAESEATPAAEEAVTEAPTEEAEATVEEAPAEQPAEAEEISAEQQAEALERRTAELEQAIAELEERCAQADDQNLRTAAEFQNFRRRARQEKEQVVRFATERLVSELLPVIDNFGRAMQVDADSPSAENLLAGVKMIYDQLLQVLAVQGVAPIEALGEAFDPTLHEAIEREETAALPPDVVVAEIAKGYRMHDRVIRPAKVRVSAAPSEASPPEETSPE